MMGTKTVTKVYVTTKNAFLNTLMLIAIKPLKYGYCVYVRDQQFYDLVDFYIASKLPYLTNNSLGYYTPDLEYRTGFGYLVQPSNYSNWLETQKKRHEQRQLLDIL